MDILQPVGQITAQAANQSDDVLDFLETLIAKDEKEDDVSYQELDFND